VATAHAPQAGGLAQAWRNFRRWQRARPFWGGLLLVLSGIELFLSGNMSLGSLSIHFGPTGFLSYVIPAILVLCGVMTWLSPAQRLFYGIVGSLVAVYSLIGLNFGGFMVGLMLGIIGGALAIAWSPVQVATPAVAGPAVDEEPKDGQTDSSWLLGENDAPRPRYDHGQPYDDVPLTSAAQTYEGVQVPADEQRAGGVYGHASEAAETAEVPRQVQDPERWWGGTTEVTTGPGDEEPPPHGDGSSGYRNRMLAITLVPATLAAVALFTVNDARPAYAAPCPTPSASAPARPKTTPSKANNQAKKPGAAPVSPKGTPNPTQPAPGASPSPSSAPPAAGTGNPLLDGWNNFVDGVKRFFGGGDSATPAPAPSASSGSSPSTVPGASGAPNPVVPVPSGVVPGQPKPSTPASASAVPCLGPGKTAVLPPGIPPVADEPGILTGTKLVMINSTFDGVTELTTGTGRKVRVLQFSMGQSDTSQFQLKVKEKNGKSTVITSDLLTTKSPDPLTSQTVKFFTPKFEGKLFGVVPMTFTPDQLPPPTPSFIPLVFTDVTIELAFVRSDILTGSNMRIREA
jgi:Family of unknown function (DUF6114)